MMKLVFVGSGVSCAVPVIGHLGNGSKCACEDATRYPDGPNRRNNVSLLIQLPSGTSSASGGSASNRTAGGATDGSKANPHEHMANSLTNVLIDCGKTFYDAYFRVLAPRNITHVDVLLLTHGHADAMQCVEDLCTLHTITRKRRLFLQRQQQQQTTEPVSDVSPASLTFIPTYLTERTLREITGIAPALVQRSRRLGTAPVTASQYSEQMRAAQDTAIAGEGDEAVEANTECQPTALDLFMVSEDSPTPLYLAPVHGMPEESLLEAPSTISSASPRASSAYFYSLPVEHGKNFISLGFVFGYGTHLLTNEERSSATEAEKKAKRDALSGNSCVVYISDVSEIIPASMAFLESLIKIDLLVLDLLAEKGRTSPPHTCWDDCMPIIRRLTPRRTYFVGMFCSLLHDPSNQLWREDLEAERTKVRAELEANRSRSGGAEGAFSAEEIGRMQRFLDEVESAELAYDGLELAVPL